MEFFRYTIKNRYLDLALDEDEENNINDHQHTEEFKNDSDDDDDEETFDNHMLMKIFKKND